MAKYIIKHYWDKTTKSATLEPQWLTSGEKLDSKREKIKDIYKKTLGDGVYYNTLTNTRKPFETIDDCKIRYSYNDNLDPLNNGTKRAIDITMQIVTPNEIISNLKKIIVASAVLFLFSAGVYLLLQQDKPEKDTHKENVTYLKKQIPIAIKSVKEKSNQIKQKKEIDFCEVIKYGDNIIVKNDNDQTKCVQSYFKKYCENKNLKISQHLSSDFKNCLGIKTINLNKLSLQNIKNGKIKKTIKKLLGDKK